MSACTSTFDGTWLIATSRPAQTLVVSFTLTKTRFETAAWPTASLAALFRFWSGAGSFFVTSSR